MDIDTSMTFTSLALIILLVIMCILLAWHCLGPRTTSWMRSNKEEKIGLSDSKLFHANGYMLSSGSEFLLSNSGSFKRFDSIDKDVHNKPTTPQPHYHNKHNHHNQHYQQQQLQHLNPTHEQQSIHQQQHQQMTTPIWNLPQADVYIPPQPLRPAPTTTPNSAGNTSKTVSFSFNQINELSGGGEEPQLQSVENIVRRSCLRSPLKIAGIPHPLQAPPPPRLTSSTSVTLSTSAIPRPMTKRQVSLQNGISSHQPPKGTQQAGGRPPLKRRNSSTNPFITEPTEYLNGDSDVDAADSNVEPEANTNTASVKQQTPTDTQPARQISKNGATPTNNSKNPFHEPNTPLSMVEVTNGEIMSDYSYTTTDTETPSESKPINVELHNLTHKIQATAGLLKQHTTNPFSGLSQRVQKGPHMLQKTISEDYLFRKLGGNAHTQSGNNGHTTWSFGRSLLRQDSSCSLGRRSSNSSQCSLDSGGMGGVSSMESILLERAISCDSVNSDTSVFQCELDQPYTQITGYLCVGLHYDKNTITNEGMELTVSVLEAKGLLSPFSIESLDTFVRIYLVPDHAGAVQTKVVPSTATPSYNEAFTFWLRKQNCRHSFWFHLYHNGPAHTLIGEAEMEIGEMPRTITTWIPLSDSRKCNARWGELMFSLSYLPTAERLTIVVVKARNLKLDIGDGDMGMPLKMHNRSRRGSMCVDIEEMQPEQVQSVFVKVYLMNNDKKVLKKRTSLKRKDLCPIFNESMIFSVPPQSLTTVQLRLTVFGVIENAVVPLGHVIAGSCAVGKGLRHWHQMLSSLRKPVAMWHVLRRAVAQPIFTGGAEAVVAAMQNTTSLQRTKRNSII